MKNEKDQHLLDLEVAKQALSKLHKEKKASSNESELAGSLIG